MADAATEERMTFQSDTGRPTSAVALTEWENEPTLQNLKQDLEASRTSHDGRVQKVDHWNDLMHIRGKARPEKVKGRSSIQPKLIRRQAEWRYSALTEPFLSSEDLFDVKPVTFEDEDAAAQNKLVLNWQFRTKLNKVNFIDSYVRTAVDEGAVIVRTGWCRITKKVTKQVPIWEHTEPTDKSQVDELEQAMQLKNEDPHNYNENAPDEIKAAVDYFEQTQQPTVAVQSGMQDVESEDVIINAPTVHILDPMNCFVDPSCGDDLSKANFMVISFETSKADLMKEPERYKNLGAVNWETASVPAVPDHGTKTPSDFNFRDTLRKRVVAYEYWGFSDIHKTGELVPIVVSWIGDTMIRCEQNPFPDQKLPFVIANYMPIKRELQGEPDAEILEDNQKILGAVTRGMIDLMGRSANGQQGYAKGFLDTVNRRRFEDGKDYEFNPNQNPLNNFVEHKYPEIPQSAMLMLNLQNQEAESLTGVKAFASGVSGAAYGDVAAGIRGALDAASKREMGILRRLAAGMAEIGKKIISMNQAFMSEEETVRVTNSTFVKVKREDIQGNFDLEVDISTAEIDNAKAQDLGFMLQTLGPQMAPEIYMMILSEIALLKRMPGLANKLKNYKPTPDPVQVQMQQLELQKLQKEIAYLDSQISLNGAKQSEVGEKANNINLKTTEDETGTTHARNLELTREQGKSNQNLQITKALTTPLKKDHKAPDVDAAIGFNSISDKLNPTGVNRPSRTS